MKTRRIGTLLLALALCLGLAAPARAAATDTVAGFTDVYAGDYYAGAVRWAVETGLTTGTSATRFSPASTLTRAQAVTFLWRAAGQPAAQGSTPFTDVADPAAYYYTAVRWAVGEGITNGVGGGRFAPDSTLTYAQMLAMLRRAAGAGGSAEADWSAAALQWAAETGLTDGLRFAAGDACPRADVVYCLWMQLTGGERTRRRTKKMPGTKRTARPGPARCPPGCWTRRARRPPLSTATCPAARRSTCAGTGWARTRRWRWPGRSRTWTGGTCTASRT